MARAPQQNAGNRNRGIEDDKDPDSLPITCPKCARCFRSTDLTRALGPRGAETLRNLLQEYHQDYQHRPKRDVAECYLLILECFDLDPESPMNVFVRKHLRPNEKLRNMPKR